MTCGRKGCGLAASFHNYDNPGHWMAGDCPAFVFPRDN